MNEKSGAEAIIAGRKAKAQAMRERGENPFANDVERQDISGVRILFAHANTKEDRYDPELVNTEGHEVCVDTETCLRPYCLLLEPNHCRRCSSNPVNGYNCSGVYLGSQSFSVAGRIIFMRRLGGATFIRLRDRTGELQIYCEETKLGQLYSKVDDFDLGDIIEAKGNVIATVKGELSIGATHIRLLTKSYRPLPTKTILKDLETRYRQRYVDLISNADSVGNVFRARSIIISAIRKYLDSFGFFEVETPTMNRIVGGAMAKPFKTHHNALDMDLFMRVAPELYLKRLVVGGFDRVYEIARCYRNEGLSTRHNPEFTMLEYYIAYSDYKSVMEHTESLLRFIDQEVATWDPKVYKEWAEKRTWTFSQFVVVSMTKAVGLALVRAHLTGKVLDLIREEAPPIKEWAELAKGQGRKIDWSSFLAAAKKCNSEGELLFCAYEYLAEPFLTSDYRTEDGSKSLPVFITQYPIEVSPLARKNDKDPKFTDRFELFVDGRELCNAFSELNDPEDQAERFQIQAAQKTAGNEEAMDYDSDYIRALEYGLPPTAGFGMGVDRLVMLLTGSPSIKDVILFPLMRPEKE